MNLEEIFKLFSFESIVKDVVAYSITAVLDYSFKKFKQSKQTNDLMWQLFDCMQKAYNNTCELLGWEEDSEAFFEASKKIVNGNTDLTCNKALCKFFLELGYLEIKHEDIECWIKQFIQQLANPKYAHLQNFIIMQSFFKKRGNLDLQKKYFDKFKKPLLANEKVILSMEDIYIPNEYKIDNKGIQYDDLLDLIDAFIKGEINLWLKRKGVSLNRDIDVLFILGHQCTGKSSLISKIACTYSLSNNAFNNIFILSFSDRDFKNNEFTIRSICSFLNVAVENLNDAIIILDGLDESEWSSTVVLDRLENLIIDLKEYNCKLIISSRPKYFCTNDFKTSLDVYLQPFTLNQAKKWLDFYSLYDENCDIEKIFNRLNSLSDDIKNIILIPYIFQICIMKDINFDTITEVGKLYDIIFDKDRGKFLQTPYNSKERNTPSNRYSFIDIISKLSFRCIDSNENSIPVDIIDTLSNANKEKFTTEFLLYRKDQNNYAFIHESIPQYFVARSMVEKFEYCISADIWNEPDKLMKNIVDFTRVIPYTIFDYVEYFSRSNRRSINLDAIKFLKLFLSNFMNIKMEFNSNLKEIQNFYYTKFVNITRLVFAFLKTSLLPFSKYEFFNALSKEELENFIFLTNLGNVPIDFMRICNYSNKSLNGINLKGVNFNGVFIKNTIIQKSNFDDANLTGAYLLNSDLSLSSFNNACCKIADFSNSILCGCSFVNAKLNGTNFSNAILDYADLRGAKLNKCRFEGTSLKGVKILIEQLQNMLDFDLNYIKRKGVEVYADDCLIPYEVLEIEYRKVRPVGYAMNH